MTSYLYRPFFAVVGLLLLLPFSASSEQIEIITSSDREFHGIISLSASDLETVTAADSSVAFVYRLALGVPPGATARLAEAHGLGGEPFEGASDNADFAALPLANISQSRMIRERRVATVLLAPVEASRMFSQVDLRVVFEGGAPTGFSRSANDPVFDRLFQATLANYDAFSTWPVPARPSARPLDQQLFSNGSIWLKIPISSTGLYEIAGSDLASAGVSLTGLTASSLRLFNGGGLPLPVPNEIARPTFDEVAVTVADGGDGTFDAGDVVRFFGEGADRWLYPADSAPYYVDNNYTDANIYWLAVGGTFSGPPQRMAAVDGAPGTYETLVTGCYQYTHIEQDKTVALAPDSHIRDYYEFYWSNQSSVELFVSTPGLLVGDSAFVALDGLSGGCCQTEGYMDLTVNGASAANKTCQGSGCTFTTYSLGDGLNDLDITLAWQNSRVPPFFNYAEVVYPSSLQPHNDRLDFSIVGTSGVHRFEVTDGFSGSPTILDISSTRSPRLITGAVRNGGTVTFQQPVSAGQRVRYLCITPSQFDRVTSIERVQPLDLRDNPARADLVIVTPRTFFDDMAEYISYRSQSGLVISTVAVEDIMDNFAFGMFDPTAIRDFLRFAYMTYPAPAPYAVLFVGDANYDFQGVEPSTETNLVPSYIHPFDEAYSDDNYVFFGDYGLLDSDSSYLAADRGFDMMAARWPVSNGGEIASIVAKIKAYDSQADFGAWRQRVTLVADDEFGTFDAETFHTTQTETLANEHVPALFNKQKIYLWDYPFVNALKPEVNREIVKSVNDGTLILNYVGHGNTGVWAHERVFQRSVDLPLLHNRDRLPMVLAASCAIGFFDDPRTDAMGEDLLIQPTGGAISVISATRLVYSSGNAAFNRQVFDLMLTGDSLSMCEAVYAAKLLRQYGNGSFPIPVANDRAYEFFGDPLQKLALPRFSIDLSLGITPDSLTALGESRVSGRVLDRQGNLYPHDGDLTIEVFDSERPKTYRIFSESGQVLQEVPYNLPGPVVFRGSASITAGEFDFSFITPLDVAYGRSGARISMYAAFDTVDAGGYVDSLAVSGVIASVTDSTGPQISVSLVGRDAFVSGDPVLPSDELLLVIEDPSGVNLAGGLGHGITLEIDGVTEQMVSLTDRFAYERDNHTRGSLSYPLAELSAGRHSFRARAWDNANNASSVEFAVEVAESTSLQIANLLNYPNPMADRTTFYFQLTQPVNSFSLEIFTLAGRRIWGTSRPGLPADVYPNGTWEPSWDGRDYDGDRVATGVYIYKASALPQTSSEAVETFGKIVLVN